jgi:hypothetical protein
MRPSFPRLIRIIPKANIIPTAESAKTSPGPTPIILPPPLTARDEAPTRVTVIQTLLRRKADGLAKEEKGELLKGAGWPVNLRVERPIKNLLQNVDTRARRELKDVLKET